METRWIDPRVAEIARTPHSLPKHSGWRDYCKTCMDYKNLVDTITGIDSQIIPPESKYYARGF